MTNNWKDIHPNFTGVLQGQWEIDNNFTYQQTQDWINAGLQSSDYDFCAWLRDIKKINAEWVLNHGNESELRQEYLWRCQQQYEARQEIPPRKSF